MSHEIFIQVRIKEETPYGELNDAIYYTQDEYLNKKESEIETDVAYRVLVQTENMRPKPQLEPTKEELMEAKAQLEAQVAELQARIEEK